MRRKNMKTFSENASQLVSHLEFDPNAFIGGRKTSQEVCNFILTLALAYNDYKFYMMTFIMLMESKPEGEAQRSAVWGEYIGIKLHIIRLQIGFVHELFNLIEKNKKILEDDFFKETIRMINTRARESWTSLVDVALMKEQNNLLARIRNKVTFHYDINELFAGYKLGFFKNGASQDACISIGNTLQKSRFYFADVAIQGYLEKKLNLTVETFFSSFNNILGEINNALYDICIKFIQRRGFAWKQPQTENK